jgi:hypothetical protein
MPLTPMAPAGQVIVVMSKELTPKSFNHIILSLIILITKFLIYRVIIYGGSWYNPPNRTFPNTTH